MNTILIMLKEIFVTDDTVALYAFLFGIVIGGFVSSVIVWGLLSTY